MAFDLFVISIILSKCDQSFSKVYYTILAYQNNLSNNIVENEKTLCLWVLASIIKLDVILSSLLDMTWIT